MSTKVHLLGTPDVRREGGATQGGSIYHDEVRDFDFADRALALRQRAGLTQRELAAHLGVSYKAIGTWEGGLSYPGAERLKQLIALYLERGVLAAGREEEEAAALWGAVRGAAARRTVPFDPHWFASLRSARAAAVPAPSVLAIAPPAAPRPDDALAALATLPAARRDWGEMPEAPVVQGRTQEHAALARWIRDERGRLVLVVGEGGIGKTTLTARLAHDLAPEFAIVYWRGLRTTPLPDDWLSGAIAALSVSQAILPAGLEARLGLLLELLRERRCLLVLDNLETILEPGVPTVRYRAGYEGYGEILRRLGETPHQSCLLVISREQPMREDDSAVRALHLHGLGVDEGRALLGHRNLAGDDAAWRALVARYSGNPLALQVVGKTVAAVFGGDIAAFLDHGVAVFGDIRELLEEQVARLSMQEQAVLRWLAEKGEPVGAATLLTSLCPLVGRATVVEAVEALARRSLLESRGQGTFSLETVVLEYVTTCLAEQSSAGGHVAATEVPSHWSGAVPQGASDRAADAGVGRIGERAQHRYGAGAALNLLLLRCMLQGDASRDSRDGRGGGWRQRGATLSWASVRGDDTYQTAQRLDREGRYGGADSRAARLLQQP